MDIPVYLVAGFLDAGKTNFINGILEDGFAREVENDGGVAALGQAERVELLA